MDGAALPARPQDLRDRRFKPGVRVTDGQLDAGESALDQASEEVGPERFGLGLADIEGKDLAAAGLMHAVGDDQRLGDDAAAGADLLDLGVQEQVGVIALQGPGAERLDLLIQPSADPADLRAADAQAETLDELVDAAGGDAADIGLLNHREQCLLGPSPRLEEAREVAALADLRDLQLDLPEIGRA